MGVEGVMKSLLSAQCDCGLTQRRNQLQLQVALLKRVRTQQAEERALSQPSNATERSRRCPFL